MSSRARMALATLLLVGSGTAVASDFQHALIVILDDVGTDKVGSYAADVENPGETRPSTPSLDLLATAGVRFSDAWATPACSSTRAQLYSGEYPHRNGIGGVVGEGSTSKLPTSPPTLQQYAADSGLTTGLFGKWHVGETGGTPDAATPTQNRKEYPITTGFTIFQGNTDGQIESYLDWLYITSVPDSTRSSGYATTAVQSTANATDQTTDDAVAWMEEQSALGQRRLTVVSYNLPHWTYTSKLEKTWVDAVTSCGGTAGADEVENARLTVECMDTELAELFSRTPDLEDTLVILTGDNGTPGSIAEGYFADDRGKFTTYENGVRVPFFVVDGRALQDVLDGGGTLPEGGVYTLSAGATVSEPASMVDVYATVVDLLGLGATTCTPGVDCARDSVSIRDLLTGGANPRDHVWTEEITRVSSTVSIGEAAVRAGDYKLRVLVESETDPCRAYELYDLANDRWELTDLYDDPAYADVQAELMTFLEEHAAVMAGTRIDWLSVEDCVVCEATETWYDGFDQDCDGADDYDQDADTFQVDVDCDDTDATVYPGATETWYDGIDQDCSATDDYDQDADGFKLEDDCDDTDPTLSPAAPETWYDDIDQDCSGTSDWDQDFDGVDWPADCDDTRAIVYPGALETWYDDVDQDCSGGSDWDQDDDGADWPGDCDDTNPAVRPGAVEVWYDGVDQDCSGGSDWDQDGDGSVSPTDCDDTNPSVRPGAPETWYDGVDQNCDGRNDYDRDGDSYPSSRYGGTDCNDGSAAIRPGATEIWYDGVDQNCDGRNDYDQDRDGYRSSAHGGTDCNDTRNRINPAASEIVGDGIDQNCNGSDAS